jgi:hypothetical protein
MQVYSFCSGCSQLFSQQREYEAASLEAAFPLHEGFVRGS